MDTQNVERIWWIAATEGVRGPLTQGEVFEEIRLGRVLANTLIRSDRAEEWVGASIRFPSAFAASEPALSAAPPVYAGSSVTSGSINDLGGKADVGIAVLLSIITVGIYWDIWIYKRLAWYSANSGRPIGNRVTYFWLFIGLLGGAVFLSLVSIGALSLLLIPLVVASIVFSGLLISDIGKDQQAIVQQSAGPGLAVTPTTLVVLWTVGNAISYTIVLLPVGIVMLVFFFIYFFRNHNAAIDAVSR